MIKILHTLLFIVLTGVCASAQELIADITVNFPKLQVADPSLLERLETQIESVLNNTSWTGQQYETHEKIECAFILNIDEELSATSFNGSLQIQASRPTFGSDYKTVIFLHVDNDVSFVFDQFSPIEFTDRTFSSNIASILSFYAYTIIGLDHDSFSPNGGDEYFQKAQDIVNGIPSGVAATFSGWRSLDGDRNRYWLIENILNPRVRDFRIAFYNYHRAALDKFAEGTTTPLEVMTKSISQIQKVNKAYPNSLIITVFVNSKSSEIIDIFKGASQEQKSATYQNMVKLDAAGASKYRSIRR